MHISTPNFPSVSILQTEGFAGTLPALKCFCSSAYESLTWDKNTRTKAQLSLCFMEYWEEFLEFCAEHWAFNIPTCPCSQKHRTANGGWASRKRAGKVTGNPAPSQKKPWRVERQKHSREEEKSLGKILFNQEMGSKLSFLENEVKVPVLLHIPKSSSPASPNPHFLLQTTFPPRVWSWKFGAREVTPLLLRWNRREQGGLDIPGKEGDKDIEIGIYPFIWKNEEGLSDLIYRLFHNLYR